MELYLFLVEKVLEHRMLKKNNVKFVMVDRPIKTDKNSYGIYSLNKRCN